MIFVATVMRRLEYVGIQAKRDARRLEQMLGALNVEVAGEKRPDEFVRQTKNQGMAVDRVRLVAEPLETTGRLKPGTQDFDQDVGVSDVEGACTVVESLVLRTAIIDGPDPLAKDRVEVKPGEIGGRVVQCCQRVVRDIAEIFVES